MAYYIEVFTEDYHEYELDKTFQTYDEAEAELNYILSDTSYLDDSMIIGGEVLKI